MNCHAASGPQPQLVPGPSATNCVAVDGPRTNYIWLPWMLRFDASAWSPGRKPAHDGNKSWLATPFNKNTMHERLLQ